MNVLVTAASKHGATAEIAERLALDLADHGCSATCVAPDDVSDLEPFDAVVLGSAVYAGHWLKPAKDLVERLGEQLRERPVWLFSSGPVGAPEPKPTEDPADAEPMMAATGALEHRVLAGRIDMAHLGLAERAVVRALRAPQGDFRDWAAVRALAEAVAAHRGAPAGAAR